MMLERLLHQHLGSSESYQVHVAFRILLRLKYLTCFGALFYKESLVIIAVIFDQNFEVSSYCVDLEEQQVRLSLKQVGLGTTGL